MNSINLQNVIEKLSFSLQEKSHFQNAQIEDVLYYKNQNKIKAKLIVLEALPFSIYKKFKSALEATLGLNLMLTVETKANITDIMEIQKYLNEFSMMHSNAKVFSSSLLTLEDTQLTFLFMNDRQFAQANALLEEVTTYLHHVGIRYDVDFKVRNEEIQRIEVKKPAEVETVVSANKEVKAYKPQKTKIKDYALVSMENITDECEHIRIEGAVFSIEEITIRTTNKIIQTVYVHDATDAITMKRFENRMFTKEVLAELHVGDYVVACGNVRHDKYSRDLVFNIDYLEVIENPNIRKDEAKEKRIELHAHTKKSEMDGVIDVEDLVKQAYKWGHEAIAITDHMVVQSFPAAASTASKLIKANPEKPFKVIYGIEMNMVDPVLNIVRSLQNNDMEQDYVIFDLETTGLSCQYDEIIEFGAVKMRHGEIIKRLQMFIKPTVPLSAFTTKMTNITQFDVDQAKALKEELPRILEFIGDSVLVAHNADFDMSFMQMKLKENGYDELKNTVIDTLSLARALFKDRRNYRLGNVARSYKIVYDEEVAHRADYDAEVLAQVFNRMLHDSKDLGCKTLEDIHALQDADAFKKVMKRHVTLLVKNQDGLKDLFKLVTISHTDYLAVFGKANSKKEDDEFMAEPRIPRETIRSLRKDLLVGSSCYNGELFELAANRSQEELEKAMLFYDYIEVQPMENYRYLIESHSLPSKERLQRILETIVHTAIKLNKLVVATGDVHYLHPEHKIYRDVYIQAQGIGGVRHPLYIYDAQRRRGSIAPNQHFKTTDEMLEDFAYFPKEIQKQLVIDNPKKINDLIDFVKPIKDKLYTPSIDGADENLRELCYKNAHATYGEILPEIVEARLEKELGSIIGHGYGVIYYISHLLVKESLRNGYLVGSRGSVGSSFAATMSEITEVNPLPPHYQCPSCKHSEFFLDGSIGSGFDLPNKNCPNCNTPMKGDGQDIPFETFLGFEGDKVPDIDLNFSGDYQEKAHAYTKVIFGEENVYRAGTVGTVAQKTAFGYVSGYAEEKGLELRMRNAQRVHLATACEGVKRTTGQHPGGIVVIPRDMDVHDFTPVQYPANNPDSEWKTTHFEFHDIHDNILKLDILGHVDPTVMKMYERISGFDVTKIPMNDTKVMSIFNSVDALNLDDRGYTEKTGALGLPEFGTGFVRQMLEATKPNTFSDLLRISGLSHGTDVWLNNAADLIKDGKTLNDVIGCRDDIMSYLIQKGLPSKSAFDIMESVRKGKGLKEDWMALMRENNVPEWYIDSCLKIKYMFPKAHAVAYVIMAVRVAWFKVYYPHYYYAAYFTLRCNAYDIDVMVKGKEAIKDRLNDIINRMNDFELKKSVTKKDEDLVSMLEVAYEMALRGYRFSNIRLNESSATEFIIDPSDEKVLIPPFTSIDGLGGNVANSIVISREERPFLSKEDLQNRTQLSTTLIKKLEVLGVLHELQDENQMSLF